MAPARAAAPHRLLSQQQAGPPLPGGARRAAVAASVVAVATPGPWEILLWRVCLPPEEDMWVQPATARALLPRRPAPPVQTPGLDSCGRAAVPMSSAHARAMARMVCTVLLTVTQKSHFLPGAGVPLQGSG